MDNKLIKIGFTPEEKMQIIRDYVEKRKTEDGRDYKGIIYFCPDNMKALELTGLAEDIEYHIWSDAIMYRCFYPLLEKISNDYIVIYDEMMRVKNRNDLTYNCCRHYSNQTDSIIVFEYLPMIDEPDDYMILVDFAYPYEYRGKGESGKHYEAGFDKEILNLADIKPHDIRITFELFEADNDVQKAYEEKKNELFDNIGNRDPNTIPRDLHIWAGDKVKKALIDEEGMYIARNSRFKKSNVRNYKNFTAKKPPLEIPEETKSEVCYIIDFPVRQMNFNDFLKYSGCEELVFLHSGLSADAVYYKEYVEWLVTLKEVFYAETGIH